MLGFAAVMRIPMVMCICLILIKTIICFDCYKFSKNEFATIKSCAFGCQYEYEIKDGHHKKNAGGCAVQNSPTGCRQQGVRTVCYCAEDYCNKQGYDMQDNSGEIYNGLEMNSFL